jgi:hypothetical protein
MDRQHNGKKMDRQYNGKKMDRQWIFIESVITDENKWLGLLCTCIRVDLSLKWQKMYLFVKSQNKILVDIVEYIKTVIGLWNNLLTANKVKKKKPKQTKISLYIL